MEANNENIEIPPDQMPPIICEKLSFEHIYNTLGAQPDILLEEAGHFTESHEAFKERMLDKLRQICH